MPRYIYRIYGATKGGYELITKTTNRNKALAYCYDERYMKILIIRHDTKHNMDEPWSLTFPDEKRRVRK